MDARQRELNSAGPKLAPRDNTAIGGSIHVLFDDILLNIFDHYRVAMGRVWLEHLLWLRLSHVCRRWRYVVYAFPSRLKARLHCTYDVPLLTDYWPTLPIALEYLNWEQGDEIYTSLNYRDRIQEINLSMEGWAMRNHLSRMTHAMPALEDLACKSKHSEVTIPLKFLGGYTPRLRTLSLDNLMLSPRLPFLLSANGLVSLQLKRCLPLTLSSGDLLEYLHAMPQLERLVIDGTTSDDLDPIASPRVSHLTGPVTLGRLVAFEVAGNDMFLDSLLSQLHLPEVLDFAVTIFRNPYRMPHFPEFASRSLGNFKTCVVNMGYSNNDVYVGASPLDTDAKMLFQEVFKHSYIEDDRPLATMKQMCSDLRSVLTSAEMASMSSPDVSAYITDDTVWRGLLSSCRSVKLLRVHGGISARLAHALTVETEESGVALLPALQAIALVCRDEDERREHILVDIFGPFIAARKQVGQDVDILHLIEPERF
ncbi:hypothetical protein BC834DRAFT_887156 [Gloeopeniophorella convolvens]|nr:hypothetical protein BC834DRAFT_887156 [Gloeopeniophorella convolvens]